MLADKFVLPKPGEKSPEEGGPVPQVLLEMSTHRLLVSLIKHRIWKFAVISAFLDQLS